MPYHLEWATDMKLAALVAVFPAIYLACKFIQILTRPKYEGLIPTKKSEICNFSAIRNTVCDLSSLLGSKF